MDEQLHIFFKLKELPKNRSNRPYKIIIYQCKNCKGKYNETIYSKYHYGNSAIFYSDKYDIIDDYFNFDYDNYLKEYPLEKLTCQEIIIKKLLE